MHHPRFLLLTVCFVQFAGCSRSPPPLPASAAAATTELIVEPEQLNLTAGGQAQLSVQANDAAGAPVGGAHFRYFVADARVLQVSDRGLVTSLGPATARTEVIIGSGRSEKRIPVSVVAAPAPATAATPAASASVTP
jgi:hypothetical protein